METGLFLNAEAGGGPDGFGGLGFTTPLTEVVVTEVMAVDGGVVVDEEI